MALSANEQLLLELINRARLDPLAEAARFGIDLNAGLAPGTLDGTAKQALAANELLNAAATGHAQWMLNTDTFSHTGQGGSSAGDRMADEGYAFTGSWTWGENISWRGTTGTPDLEGWIYTQHQGLFESAGHRENILNGAFRETGLSQEQGVFTTNRSYNASMVVEKFAKSGSSYFITGVAYNDNDGNAFYTPGEGVGSLSVTVAGVGADATESAGGYGIATASGTHTVTLGSGPGAVTVEIELNNANAKLDLVDGVHVLSSADIELLSGASSVTLLGVSDLDATGGSAGEILRGNSGSNVLSGGGGDDWIAGGSGSDTLNGGAGDDTIIFDALDNLAALDGGTGNDTLVVNGGSVPVLDLAAHGFEAAEHVMVDSGQADWQEITDHYIAGWLRTSQDGRFDDGRTWHTDWDVAGAFAWSDRQYNYDTLGRLHERIETLDEGRSNVTRWDVDGTEVWSRQVTSHDLGSSYSWSSNSLRYDDLGRLYEQVGTYDNGRTWHTQWDVTGSEVWSRQFSQDDTSDTTTWSTLVLRYDDLNRLYEQTGTYDDGRTYNIRWDLDGAEPWHKEVTQDDVADTAQWSTLLLHYDDQNRLYEKTEARDNGISYTIRLDVDGTEVWDRQIVTEDLADDYSWATKTNSYDDLGRAFEQTGTYDDGRTWQTRWDLDGTEVWSREMTTFDGSDTIFYTEITNRYDDQNRLFEQTGVYDDGRTWQTVWDLEGTETWHQQRHIFDTADNHSWSDQIFEYDQSGNLLNLTVIDDPIV